MMKKLSKKSTEFIELFFNLKNMDSITIKRHDMDILYSHYKYSWYEFNKFDNEIQRLNNIINQARRMLGEHKHYSTPTEEQNTENEKIVNDVYFLLHNNLLGDESNENIKR